MKKVDLWSIDHFKSSPIIRQLEKTTQQFNDYKKWPTIEQYQAVFSEFSLDIKPVHQAHEINSFEELYEPRVYLKKELQTRTHNWHDFFNAQIWLNFPKTKKVLNSLHYSASIKRPKGSNRSTLENRITQFDECGAILVSSDKALLKLIKEHEWTALFINHRHELSEKLRCIVFGHAIFEKAISPYIGMTCHCLLVEDEKLLKQAKNKEYSAIDDYLSTKWQKEIAYNPTKFDAFPVLGLPDYWHDQENEFYQNKQYFR